MRNYIVMMTLALASEACASTDIVTPSRPVTPPAAATPARERERPATCASPPPPGAFWLQTTKDRCVAAEGPLLLFRMEHDALVSIEAVTANGSVFLKDLRTQGAPWFKGTWVDGRATNLIPAAPAKAWLDDEFEATSGLLLENGFLGPVPPISGIVKLPKGVRVIGEERDKVLNILDNHVQQHLAEEGVWSGTCEHSAITALAAALVRSGY